MYNPHFPFTDPVQSVTLSVSNLAKSLSKFFGRVLMINNYYVLVLCHKDYWHKLLGLKVYSQTEKSATLGYDHNQVRIQGLLE